MTLTLILMRHAKSSWGDPLLDDIERPLNGRGRKSAAALGKWLREQEYIPQEVIVSTARRSAETWSRMASKMLPSAQMRSEPALYLASPDTMLTILKGATAQTVMMIGHNPGCCAFAHMLAHTPADHARFEDCPTGATTVMTFQESAWSDIAPGKGAVQAFTVPRVLLG